MTERKILIQNVGDTTVRLSEESPASPCGDAHDWTLKGVGVHFGFEGLTNDDGPWRARLECATPGCNRFRLTKGCASKADAESLAREHIARRN